MQLLQALVKNDGSDLHIAAKSVPMLRISGEMTQVKTDPLTPEDVQQMVSQIINKKQGQDLLTHKTLDLAFNAPNIGVFRVNVFYQRHGLSMVFRKLPENPPTVDDLNLPPIFKKAATFPNGLILVTGPTGSGKSTTMAAMLDYINTHRKGHILTIEDPVEFRHVSKSCMVNQRSLGDHFTDFHSALKAALREDPDVILVGEMRDLETISLALEAAETGHLVFGTVHTNSAAKTIDRLINVFPPEQQNQIRLSLSETAKMICSQKLVPKKGGGRMCFQDILINTPAISNLIRENKTVQITTSMQTGKALGMQLLDKELLIAVNDGIVDGVTGWEAANDKSMFKQFEPKGIVTDKDKKDAEEQKQSA